MVRIKSICDVCKKLLRKADAHECLREDGVKKYDRLCKECFDKWLGDELE